MKEVSNVFVIMIRIIIYYDTDISFFKSITYTVVSFSSHAVVHMDVDARWRVEGGGSSVQPRAAVSKGR